MGPDATRLLTLNEHMTTGPNASPIEALVNNSKWGGLKHDQVTPIPGSELDSIGNWVTELPRVGSTEVWHIANLTADAHPIHLHLVQFQILGRQKFDQAGYQATYDASFPSAAFEPANGPPLHYKTGNPSALGGNPAIGPFLTRGTFTSALPAERGWTDTVITYPGDVTTIIVRYAPQDVRAGGARPGVNKFPFDPTAGPGYVWHCHIIDHEDNEMMRPQVIKN